MGLMGIGENTMQHHSNREHPRSIRHGVKARRLALALAVAVAPAWAADDTIDWRVIAGGGTTNTSGSGYTLAGTIG